MPMKQYHLWYNNGTGYFEGPYSIWAASFEDAIDKSHLRWCTNMYGREAVVDSIENPNLKDGPSDEAMRRYEA